MEAEVSQCHNRRCGALIAIKRGHRRRKYCDDTCKQAEHRARDADTQRAKEEAAREADLLRARDQLRKKYGNLLSETFDLLLALPESASQIAKVIIAEREHAQQNQTQERNALVEEILLTGEKLGFPLLKNDDFLLKADLDNWLILCEDADIATLYQTRDIVSIKLQAQEARKRLKELAPYS